MLSFHNILTFFIFYSFISIAAVGHEFIAFSKSALSKFSSLFASDRPSTIVKCSGSIATHIPHPIQFSLTFSFFIKSSLKDYNKKFEENQLIYLKKFDFML